MAPTWRHVAPFFCVYFVKYRHLALLAPSGAKWRYVEPFFNANKMAPPWRHVALVIKNIENRHVAPRGAGNQEYRKSPRGAGNQEYRKSPRGAIGDAHCAAI